MVVWQNTFDGVPGANITPANSASWGDPIDSIRTGSANGVRYGDISYLGRSSMQLGTPDASNHGDVWVYYPTVNNYSLSFYLYLPEGGWFRFRDQNNLAELYIATASGSFVAGQAFSEANVAQLFDRWVRIEAVVNSTELAARIWWTDPNSTGEPDYQVTTPRAGGTVGGLFAQGGSTQNVYMDQVRVGEGEWLGPWPTHQTLTASASLPLAGSAQISAELDDGTLTASATLPLAASASLTRQGQVEAAATLPLAGSARIVRHARMDASATIGELSAPPVDITREGRFTAGATLSLAGAAELRSQFRATFPPMIITELLLDGEWVDVSGDVRTSEPVSITRGRADEAATADPATCSLLLNNRHGKYSPHNPMSPYYGHIGKNTPLRVRVGPIPDEIDLELEDAFDRTVSGGWGVADTGQAWTGATTGASVSEGAARHQVTGIGNSSDRQSRVGLGVQDMDVTVSVSIDGSPQGWIAGGAFATIDLRHVSAGGRVSARVGFRVDTGFAGGLRVTTGINEDHRGAFSVLAPVTVVQGLAYQPGDWLRARVQISGPDARMRVWAEGGTEPDVWHSQAYLGQDGPAGAGLALRSVVTDDAYDTDLPVTISYRALQARPIVDDNLHEICRFSGEVSEWPARWDVSDSDVWVPVAASGILRRLGQGSKPLRSVLRRTIQSDFPVAYWPLEDGARTRDATSVAEGTGALRTSGFAYAEDTSLPTSGPLPTLTDRASMSVQSLASGWTGTGWEVSFLYSLEFPREAYVGSQPLLGIQTATDTILVDLIWDVTERPRVRTTVNSASGAQVARQSIFTDVGDVTFYNAWRRFRVYARQQGSSVELYISRVDDANASWGHAVTYTGTLGRVTGITTQFGDQLEGMAIGHLTVWGAPGSTAYFEGFPGYDRETARGRIDRMSASVGVPMEITGAASEALGVEQRGTYLEVITAAQEADFGAPGEARHHLGLTYRGRDLLYHSEPALTLDYMGGEISPPMEPTDDDQALRNDVEVTRDDGASFQVEDTDGPLGVDRVGRYDTSVTLNLGTDRQAEHHAGWRLHLGTVDELRWPMIHLNLANPRLSARVEDVLALDVGDRIRVLNPPPWTQAAHLDLIVQGYTERLNVFQWEIELACTPASPWQPAQIGTGGQAPPDAPMRADTAGCELPFNIGQATTSVVVETTRGPTWVTTAEHPDSLPFDITVGGEVMRVLEVVGGGSVQTFTVERAVNGITKPHQSGTAVRLAHPAVVAL